MRWGRVVSSCAASLAVVGCAVVVVGINRAASKPVADPTPTASPSPTYRPAVPTAQPLPDRPDASLTTAASVIPTSTSRSSTAPRTTAAAPPSTSAARPAPSSSSRSASTSRPAYTATVSRAPATHATTHRAAPRRAAPPPAATQAPAPHRAPTHRAAPARGGSLPLGFYTGSATRVITVVASSHSRTTATLQAWNKAPGGGWWRYGSAVTANVGSDGLSTAASEYRSATPIGSFSLTRAFGHYSDPGTALPYTHTNSHYWWISDVRSPLYNTMQYCHPGCSFAHDPNEHLYYETPYYNYAVVIDYNTRRVPGAGSAFFLHVAHGGATAGCVSISQTKLVSLMRWLTPSAHPRILIGVS